MGWRSEPKNVEQQRLVVALPAVFQEAALGFPAMRHRRATVQCPLPVRPAVERVGDLGYLPFASIRRIKIRSRGQGPGI
ncbi:hypothetical protein D9M72_564260 [compost metagenome]